MTLSLIGFKFACFYSPFRARGHFRGRGTLRNDFRSSLRNNTNNYVMANHREEETFKVTIPMSAKYEQLYLADLLRANLADPSVAFYNVSTPMVVCVCYRFLTESFPLYLVSKRTEFLCFLCGGP